MRKSLRYLLGISVSALFVSEFSRRKWLTQPDHSVDGWITTGDKSHILERMKRIEMMPLSKAKTWECDEVINVDANTTYQSIDGFGAALTYSSAYVMRHYLTAEKRKELIKRLFSKEENSIGIDYIRLSIGACDFSPYNYSYADTPGDVDLKTFSIDIEKKEMLSVLKEILEVNPNIKIVASPWSPPGWMKTTNSMIGGMLKPEYYGVYAKYFVKYIQAMKKEGVPIDAITIQNEPLYGDATYPCMLMPAEDQRDFIKYHLGPQFKENNITTKIITYDHNWEVPLYSQPILQDPEAAQYVDGTTFHAYKGELEGMGPIKEMFPDKNIYFTEQSGGTWAPIWWDNIKWYFDNLIIGTMRFSSKNVLFWNLALDEHNGPTNNGCLTCRGVVTVCQNGTVQQNEEFTVLGHVGRHVQQGAFRCRSNQDNEAVCKNVAFVNPDKSRVLVLLNTETTRRKINVIDENRAFLLNLPKESVASLKWT